MKTLYATLKINILVEEAIINGQNELALSDEVYDLVNKLENWLKRQETLFDFKVEDA